MTSLEQWLSEATHGLSAESAALVRAEIQQHCDSACETGETVDAAIAALGDPRAANRGYRKVLLTEREAMMAPALTQFKRPGVRFLFLLSAVAAGVIWRLSLRRQGPGLWPIAIVIYCGVFLRYLPATTLARCRVYMGLIGVQSILLGAIAWWYYGWINGVSLAAGTFVLSYLVQRDRMSIFRKLEAGQTYRLLPEVASLTPIDALVLRGLQDKVKPLENVSTAIFLISLAGVTIWLPRTFAPMAACVLAIYLAQRMLPIDTEQRSRRYLTAKWILMVVAAALPVWYGARMPWTGAILLLYLFGLFDRANIALRRKVPVAQWPKRLYW